MKAKRWPPEVVCIINRRYRQQRAREKIAHVKHVARRQQEERERRAWLEAAAERRRQEWLADPRRQQIQQLVNVLVAWLYSHPMYKQRALFHTIFGRQLNDFWDLTGFNIVKFDEQFIKPSVDESTKQAVRRLYGDNAVALVYELIGKQEV
jgi:hypothetical protein